MWEFFLATQNSAFTLSLMLVAAIGLVEAVGLFCGFLATDALESCVPELTDDSPNGSLAKLYSWLNFGRIPVLMLVVVALTLFASFGFIFQSMSHNLFHSYIPPVFANTMSLFAAIPACRLFTGILQKIMPMDESEAVSEESFIGRMATITLGEATQTKFAEAKLKDELGKTHYIQVYPDKADETFQCGESVLIVRKQGAYYFGIIT